jgi:hypothetical protein
MTVLYHPEIRQIMLPRMLRAIILGLILHSSLGGLAFAQSNLSSSGSIFPAPNDMKKRHMSPTGKPCLTLEAYSKTQVINKDIYEHWVGATNSCGQHIKVKVCYYETEDCIVMDVPPYDRQDSVLGIYPALKDFRYDAKEQF